MLSRYLYTQLEQSFIDGSGLRMEPSRIPEIVAQAVTLGLLTVEQALQDAAANPESLSRGLTYACLLDAGVLTPEQADAARAQCGRAWDELGYFHTARYVKLVTLIGKHSDPTLLPDLICRVLSESDPWTRQSILRKLSPHLSIQSWMPILAKILALPDQERWKSPRGDGLSMIAPFVPSDLADRVLEGTLALPDVAKLSVRAEIAFYLAPKLTRQGVGVALKFTESLADDHNWSIDTWRAKLYTVLGNRLEEPQRTSNLSKAFDLGMSIKTYELVAILEVLAPHLTEDRVVAALDQVFTIDHPETRCNGLIALMDHVSEHKRKQLITTVLETILAIQAGTPDTIEDEHRWWVINRLVSHLPDKFLDWAVSVVQKSVHSNEERSYALQKLAERAQGDMILDLRSAALEAALGEPPALHTYNPAERPAMLQLASVLEGALLDRAFEMLLAPRGRDGFLQGGTQGDDEAWQKLSAKWDRWSANWCAAAIGAMAPRLNVDQVRRVLAEFNHPL